jgi:hypothetical protein
VFFEEGHDRRLRVANTFRHRFAIEIGPLEGDNLNAAMPRAGQVRTLGGRDIDEDDLHPIQAFLPEQACKGSFRARALSSSDQDNADRWREVGGLSHMSRAGMLGL